MVINPNFVINKGLIYKYRILTRADNRPDRSNIIYGVTAIKTHFYELPRSEGRTYWVPAKVTNHLGITHNVLATCLPFYERVDGPFWMIDEKRRLVNAEDAGFIDSSLGYTIEHHTFFCE
jgi:hypothetical protein